MPIISLKPAIAWLKIPKFFNANSKKGKEITNIATSTIKKIIKELKLL